MLRLKNHLANITSISSEYHHFLYTFFNKHGAIFPSIFSSIRTFPLLQTYSYLPNIFSNLASITITYQYFSTFTYHWANSRKRIPIVSVCVSVYLRNRSRYHLPKLFLEISLRQWFECIFSMERVINSDGYTCKMAVALWWVL